MRKQMDENIEKCDDSELQVLTGNTQFAFKLYKILAQQEGNVFFSPLSIHTSLAIIYQGAQNSTANLLANTLGVVDAKSARQGYKVLLQHLNSVQHVTMSLANKIFIKDTSQLVDDFKVAVTHNFNTEVESINFDDNEMATKKINDWVKHQTNEKIQEIVETPDFDEPLRVLLLNAIYFQGLWRYEFNKNQTTTEQFYVNKNETIQVEMMHLSQAVPKGYSEYLQARIIELPYGNDDLGMVIILPNEKDGIGETEKKLSHLNFSEIVENLRVYIEIDISLPKFRIEQTIDLKDPLITLGLGEVFDENRADFSNMIEGNNFAVSKVKQKAFIEINEVGSTAGVITESFAMVISIDEFNVDHPFIFFIVQKSTPPTPLFVGKVVKP